MRTLLYTYTGILGALFCANLLHAGVEPALSAYHPGNLFVNYPNSPTYVANGTFSNNLSAFNSSLPPYSFPNNQKVRKIDNLLQLYLDPNLNTYIDSAYSLEVQLKLTKYALNAISPATENITLTIHYDPKARSKWIEKANYHFGNCGRVDYEVLSVSLKPGGSTPLSPQQIKAISGQVGLRSDIVIERYYNFDVFTPLTGPTAITATYDATKNELNVNWNLLPGAEYYDLEWAYVDDYGVTGKILPQDLKFNEHFNLARNATRVQIAQNNYKFPLIFRSGYLLFRVRGIGMDYEPTTDVVYRMEGSWSSDQGSTVLAWPHKYQITSPFESDKFSWQLVTTYAEEGKSKSVLTLMDGTLRARQTLTGLSSEQEAMVAETVYDHQGRPAVQILPVPTHDPRMKYYKNFNLQAPGQPYNRNHFDLDLGNCQIAAAPLNTSLGAAQYYSPNNPVKTDAHAYLPDAAGYPFVHTEFTPDNTGRIRRQGGVGPEHKLDSGHETVYYYGTPVQEELNRLFGVEVGEADHYKKNVVEDPNGQLSVSFLDLKGKVIATALAGNPPPNLDSLESRQPYQMDIDLMVFNQVGSLDNVLSATRSFTVTNPSAYQFNYTVSRPAFEAALCNGQKLCYDCVYDLEIAVVDNYSCDTIKYNVIQQINPLQFNQADSIIVDAACPKKPTAHSNSFRENLDVGSYTILKKLKVNPAATDAYIKDYLHRFEQTCKSVYDSILQHYLSQVDSLACEIPDDEEALNRCEVARAGMLADLSPGGQYGLIDWDGNTASDPLSIYNPNNRLPEAAAYWRTPFSSYLDETGKLDSIINAQGNKVPPQHGSITLADFVQNWKDSWAVSLLNYHPEYCYLQWCEADNPAFDYDLEIASINKYSDAASKGYFSINNPSSLRAKDPYFTTGGGGNNNTDISWIDKQINTYYQTPPPVAAPYSMLQVAVWTALLRDSVFSKPQPTKAITLADVNAWINNPNSGNSKLADTVWAQFRFLYLAKKEQLQYGKRTIYAIACPNLPNKPNQGGYNECIGSNPFLWTNNGFGGGGYGSNTPYFNSNQACNWKTFQLYSKKPKRFPSAHDLPGSFDPYGPPAVVLQQAADFVGEQQGLICDSCICNRAFTQFVNWVIDKKPYLSPNQQFPMPNAPFVTELQAFIKKCNGKDLANISAVLLNNRDLRITLYDKNKAYSAEVFIKVPSGNLNYWEFADSISCIRYKGQQEIYDLGTGTLFGKNKEQNPVNILVRPNCILEKCSGGGLNCPPTAQAQALAQLFNALISQQKLDKTTRLDSNYLNPDLWAYFNPVIGNSTLNWVSKLLGNSLQVTLSSGQVNCRLTLELPVGIVLNNLGPVLSFRPDPSQIDPATGYTYQAIMRVIVFNKNAQSVIEIKVKSACFAFSYCEKCPPGTSSTRSTALTPNPANPGKNPGNPVIIKPAPVTPGISIVPAPGDLNKPCYPCDELDYTLDYDSLILDTQSVWVQQLPPADICDPCAWPTEYPPVLPVPNPCYWEQVIAAYANATYAYEQYLDSLTRSIRNDYIRHCLAAAETFTAKYEDDLHHFTLYYYDQAGNLLKTVPPAGVKPLDAAGAKLAYAYNHRQVKTPVLPAHTMPSNYTYNSLNQLRLQSIPDHDGESVFFYDFLSRIVVSQNPEQQKNNRYSYTLYDPLNRPYETGEVLNASTPMSDALAKNETQLKNWINALPKRELTLTQYDMPLPGIAQKYFNGNASNYRDRIASVTYSELDGSPIKHSTYYQYDIHGNVAQLVQELHQLGAKRMHYDYDLISGRVNQVWYQPNEPDQFLHRYQYDADNRLISVRTSRDGMVWDLDADYFYYRHGPLARMELGENKVQGLDYAYTLQGWIKGVNSAVLNEKIDIGRDGLANHVHQKVAKDAFGYTLRYYTQDYQPIAPAPLGWEPAYQNTSFHRPQRDLYNGNIQSMITSIGNPVNANTNFKPLGYAYNYDQLNRITAMRAYDRLNPTTNQWAASAAPLADYATRYTYDANGNLLSLNRKGSTANNAPLNMDAFRYNYHAGRNRLEYVQDSVPAANYPSDIDDQKASNYQYDAIGNLIEDKSEQLLISWNVAGKVKAIQKQASKERIQFSYDPTGKRVLKSVSNASTQKTESTYYILDATGNVMATYTRSTTAGPLKTSDFFLQSFYLYGSSRLGEERIDTSMNALLTLQKRQNNTWYSFRSRGSKYFELGNHLGNVLTTVSDRKLPFDSGNDQVVDGYAADIWTAQDYYPFGSGMPGREFDEGGYQYGFNGKENDDEVKGKGNYQDYGMRAYDGRLGRFFSVDPITAEYPELTPFQFAGNNPIKFIDLDGLEPAEPGKEVGEVQTAPQTTNCTNCSTNQSWMWTGEEWQYSAKEVTVTPNPSVSAIEIQKFQKSIPIPKDNVLTLKISPYEKPKFVKPIQYKETKLKKITQYELWWLREENHKKELREKAESQGNSMALKILDFKDQIEAAERDPEHRGIIRTSAYFTLFLGGVTEIVPTSTKPKNSYFNTPAKANATPDLRFRVNKIPYNPFFVSNIYEPPSTISFESQKLILPVMIKK